MLIASLAAISGRQDTLQLVVDSILGQTVPPDKLLIYYSVEPWHLDTGWARSPVLRQHSSIEILRVPNCGSSRKYLFPLLSLRNTDATIVLLDDDRVWHHHVFERLLRFSRQTDCIATTRGWSRYKVIQDVSGLPLFHDLGVKASDVLHPAQVAVVNSGWATCLRTAHVSERIFSEQLHAQAELRYSDEIVLSAMLTRRKYVVPMPAGFCTDLPSPLNQSRAPNTTAAKLKQISLFGSNL
jgi:hypothetical protein